MGQAISSTFQNKCASAIIDWQQAVDVWRTDPHDIHKFLAMFRDVREPTCVDLALFELAQSLDARIKVLEWASVKTIPTDV